MNVLFLSPYTKAITGGNKRYERLVSYGLRKGCNSKWVIRESERGKHLYEQVVPLRVYKGLGHTIGFFVACVFNSKLLLKHGKKIDFIHVFGETPVLSAVYLSFLLGVPLSIGVRSDNKKILQINLANKNKFQKCILKFRSWLRFIPIYIGYKFCRAIVVQSDFAKENFCTEYNVPREKVIVVPNDLPLWASDFSKDRLSRVYRRSPKSILFVGSDTQLKGFDVLLQALISLKKFAPGIQKVYLAGDDFERLPEVSGVEIIVLGRVEGVANVMYNSDLLVVPSRDDQFPNVVLEAFATGLPVIGSRVSGVKYLINDESFLFDPNSFSSLLECLNYVQSEAGYSHAVSYVKERVYDFDFPWEQVYFDRLCEKML